MSILVHSGCYNRIPQIEWLIKNRNLFLMFRRLGSPRSRRHHIRCLVRIRFLINRWSIYSLCPHIAEELRAFSKVSFARALIPFIRPPPYDLITSQRSHLLISSPLELGFQVMNDRGTQTVKPQQCLRSLFHRSPCFHLTLLRNWLYLESLRKKRPGE